MKHGFITETKKKFTRKALTNLFCMSVKAEGEPTTVAEPTTTQATEPTTNQEPTVATTTINYEDLISKARQEEKAKLYPKLKALESEKANLIEKNNGLLLKVGTLETENESLRKQLAEGGNSDLEVIASKDKEIATLKKEIENLKANTVSVEEVEERVRNEVSSEYEVKLYRLEKLKEVGDSVIPELVMGSTKEDIDKSLELAQKRFEEIVSKTMGGIKVPPVNPSTSKFMQKDFNMEDLANMNPRSKEYAEMRKKLGLR